MLPDQTPVALHELAFDDDHVSVELPLLLTFVGLADKATLGNGTAVGVGAAVGVNVAVRVGVAVGVDVAVRVDVAVGTGETAGVFVGVYVGVGPGLELGAGVTDAEPALLLAVLAATSPPPPPPQATVQRGKVKIRKRRKTRELNAVSIISLAFIPDP